MPSASAHGDWRLYWADHPTANFAFMVTYHNRRFKRSIRVPA